MISFCLKFALIRARKRGGKMNEKEMAEIKEMLLQQMQMITLQIKLISEQKEMLRSLEWVNPDVGSIAYLAVKTSKSRQAITQYIKKHFKMDQDYWYVGKNTINVSEECMKKIVARRVK